MAELLKNTYSDEYIKRLGKTINRFHSSFNEKHFVKDVLGSGWADLELKQRMARISESIYKNLNCSYEESIGILNESAKNFTSDFGFFFPDFIEKYGMDDWNVSMKGLAEQTIYSTSEFAIRPFIVSDQIKAMKQMLKWSKSKNEHVRRLSSEGCRPRLPWSFSLKELVKDPSSIIPILENLVSDESLYVRKSVANNLNDISKDHPELALKLALKWYKTGNEHSQWIVKHGMRTLLKAGNPKALKIFGYSGKELFKEVSFEVITPLVLHNDKLKTQIDFTLKRKGKVRIEYAIHFLRKKGDWGKKVFKVSEKEIEKGDHTITREHHFKTMTTRSYNEGVHAFEVILNGQSFGIKPFVYWKKISPYQVYILKTKRNTLYCGVTTDINRRYKEHLGIKPGGAKFTKAQKPEAMLYLEKSNNRSLAQKRESEIKKLKRADKMILINHSFGISPS
jgi:3-methyladenine DNA glycosylase AlkC/predicted GIY-YIG superfamily endonuclease